jgi:hypothetical protein
VAGHKNRKNKKALRDKHRPNYSFLVSWSPNDARVKRDLNSNTNPLELKLSASKKAEIQAKIDSTYQIKKDIIKSLILVSFVLIVELVVYLARNQIKLP